MACATPVAGELLEVKTAGTWVRGIVAHTMDKGSDASCQVELLDKSTVLVRRSAYHHGDGEWCRVHKSLKAKKALWIRAGGIYVMSHKQKKVPCTKAVAAAAWQNGVRAMRSSQLKECERIIFGAHYYASSDLATA